MEYLIVSETKEVETGDGESILMESFEIFEKEVYNTLASLVDAAIEEWFVDNEIYSLYIGGDIFIEYVSPADFWRCVEVQEITENEYDCIRKVIGNNYGINFNFLHNWLELT